MTSPDILDQNPYSTQSYNRYSYVTNNPLKYVDPSGYYKYGTNYYSENEYIPENAYYYGMMNFMTQIGSASSFWENKEGRVIGFGPNYVVVGDGNTGGTSEGGDKTTKGKKVDTGGKKEGETGGGETADYLLGKLYWHYQFGGASDFNLDASTMNFRSTSQRELKLTGMKIGDSRGVNLFDSGINQYSLAFGKLTMTYQGNNQFSIESNRFDFDYQSNSSFSRNAGTFIGGLVFEQFYTIPITPFSIIRNATEFGGSIMINFNRTIYIPK